MKRLAPLLLLLLVACAAPPPRDDAAAAEAAAAVLLREGDYAGAARQYLALAERDPRRHDSYRLLAAEAWREEGRLERVAEVLTHVQGDRLPSNESARLDLLLAEVALDETDADAALTLLAGAPEFLPASMLPRYHELKARALEARLAPFEAARERARLDRWLVGAEREDNLEALRMLLRRQPLAALLERQRDLDHDDPLRPILEDLLSRAGVPSDGGFAPLADVSSEDGYRVMRRVALLLPASGPLAGAAQAVRDGFMTAYFADARERPEVRVYDEGLVPGDALLAYRRALADGAERVIGPLTREGVAQLFADGMPSVPLLALNHAGSGMAPWGSYEFGMLPGHEGRFLAERLLAAGVRQVALVSASEDFAERAASAFRIAFEAGGGRLLGEVRVGPGATDYSEPLGEALDVGLAERRRRSLQAALSLELRGEPVFRPDIEAAVLIARSGFARLLVPQIRVFTAGTLPLLATSHVFSGEVNPKADRDLDDLEFCDMAWLIGAETPMPSRDTLGSLPGQSAGNARLFAFGMDAYRLLGYLDWLAEDPSRRVNGASGHLSIAPGGQVRRHLACARFVEGTPQPLNEPERAP